MSKVRVKKCTMKLKGGAINPKAAHLTQSQIDSAINKISGSNDYMKDMERIIGTITTIQKEYYQLKIKRVKTIYKEIEQYLDTIRPITNKESVQIIDDLKEHYIKLNLNMLYERKVNRKTKEAKEKLAIKPKDIISSPWFAKMRNLELMTAGIKQQFKIDGPTMSDATQDIIRTDYDAVTTFKFLNLTIDAVINDVTIAAIVYYINKHCNDIFNILYEPMYDYRKYIQTHWLSEIDTILSTNEKVKSKLGENKGLTREEAQNYVALFAKAKYRMTLLDGNAADFTKIIFDVLGETDIANLDASRFMDIVGSINVKEIDKSGKLQQTLDVAKENIRKIGTEDFKFEDIVADFSKIMGSGNDKEEEKEQEPVEVVEDNVF